MRSKWKRFSIILLMLAAFALALSGCSGSDGSAGAPGTPGTSVTGPTGPTGADGGTNAANMNTETMAALNPVITVDSVTINSKPVVKFTVKNGRGYGIKGLGFTTQSTVADSSGNFAIMPSVSNFNFNLAKLVPANATTGAPSKWVSYIVTTVPTKTAAGVAVPSVPRRPTTEAQGTLEDNGDGKYTYTFYRDIAKIKDEVKAATETATNKNADLGGDDLAYDATKIHRLVIRFTGNVRGTGTNTADGTSSGVTAVSLENPKIIVHDFIPSPYRVVAATDTQREISTNAACNSCHFVVPGHNGGTEIRNCVMCHNDQIKYGRAKTTSALAAGTGTRPVETTVLKTGTTNVFETTTGLIPGTMGVTGTKTATISTNPLTGADTPSTRYTPAAYVIDGETLGDFPIMIHKLHMGNLLNRPAGRWDTSSGKVGPQWRAQLLKKTGFGYNLMGYYAFQDMREYPLSPMNCRKCHVTTAPQANNWKTKPSRAGCGSCHDGINWTTGGGITLGNVKSLGTTYAGHIGGPAADDSKCGDCHKDASIYHVTEASTPLNPEVWSDLSGKMATITRYELDSVTVDPVTNYPTVVFRIIEKKGTADWTPVTLNTLATASKGTAGVDGAGSAAFYLANSAATGATAAGGSRTGFSGGPSFLIHWSTTGGVDWDNFGSGNTRAYPGLPSAPTNSGVYLVDLITGTGGDIISGPDATGHYTAVLESANTHSSTTGKILTVAEAAALAAPTNPAISQAFPAGAKLRTVQMLGNFNQRNLGAPYTGGVTIPSPAVIKSVDKEERRSVFTMAKCQACHEAGYGNESDGGGHATPGDFASCITCHNPMMAGNGLDPTATAGFTRNNVKTPHGWNFKSLMHEKHAEANKMESLKRCEKCHLTTASYSSVPAGALPTTIQVVYAAPGTGTVSSDLDLITSPYASACLACHSNADAANHAKANGALVNQPRSLGGTVGTYSATVPLTKFVSAESCGTCHGIDKAYDVVEIHKRKSE